MDAIKMIYSAIYLLLGIMTLIVGLRFLLAKEYFPYHVEVTKVEWVNLDESFQTIIKAIMRMAGISIFSLAIVIISYAATALKTESGVQSYLVPISALLFWGGAFKITYSVHKKTKANTPWKGSLLCILLILLGLIVSLI